MPEDIQVTFVGDFTEITARFRSVHFHFERHVTRIIPGQYAHHFLNRPSPIFLIEPVGPVVRPPGEYTHVLVRRAGALGDVISTHAALVALKLKYGDRLKISFQVALQYAYLFDGHWAYERVLAWNSEGTERAVKILHVDDVLVLDRLFEADHQPNGPRDSRIERTWRALAKLEYPWYSGDFSDLTPDFGINIPEEDRKEAYRWLNRIGLDRDTRKGPMIAMSAASVTDARTPNPVAVRGVIDELVHRGYTIFIMDGTDVRNWSEPKIFSIAGCTVRTSLAIMEHCDLAITPDSGSMWMAHTVPLPLVALLGPTPPETKVNYHPLRSLGGVRAIETNKWIDCPSCYEYATACDYKFSCLKKVDQAKFVSETIKAVDELLEVSRDGKVREKRSGPNPARCAPVARLAGRVDVAPVLRDGGEGAQED